MSSDINVVWLVSGLYRENEGNLADVQSYDPFEIVSEGSTVVWEF